MNGSSHAHAHGDALQWQDLVDSMVDSTLHDPTLLLRVHWWVSGWVCSTWDGCSGLVQSAAGVAVAMLCGELFPFLPHLPSCSAPVALVVFVVVVPSAALISALFGPVGTHIQKASPGKCMWETEVEAFVV